jgi:hypothetical protein
MFGPSGVTVAVEKKEWDDFKVVGTWQGLGDDWRRVTVLQWFFYVGIKAVTDIVTFPSEKHENSLTV